MYYELTKFIVTEVIDITIDYEVKDGNFELDISIKIPLTKSLEEAYDKLTKE